MRNRLIDRRTLLRGAGAALALPLLETMGWAEGKTGKPPVRLSFMYMSHGAMMERFWQAESDAYLAALPAETDPRAVFKRLFQVKEQGTAAGAPDAGGDPLDQSVLDLVLGGAKDLRGKLTPRDRQKLDEYLDVVRALERRIFAMEQRR